MIRKIYVTPAQVSGYVHEIIRGINYDDWRPDYIVGLSRGGLTPALMLSHYLRIPMHTLEISLRDGGKQVSDLGMAEDAFGYEAEPKKILIVDDINDSGATMNWLKADWQAGCLPNSERWSEVWNQNVRFAVLHDNQSSEFSDVDYAAVDINKVEDDCWIVYPWENWWSL